MTYRAKGLLFEDVLFDASPSGGADCEYYLQRSEPIEGAQNTPFSTSEVSIEADDEELIKRFDSNTRNEVRRSRDKDGVVCEMETSPEDWFEAYAIFYNDFAKSKGLEEMDEAWVRRVLVGGNLIISRALTPEGTNLVWHSYCVSGGRNRLLHSASLFRESEEGASRQLVGRANRLLHYADMIKLRDLGHQKYDFGGWYSGSEDEAKLKINDFKAKFGGTPTTHYNVRRGCTAKGKAFLKLKKLLGK